MIPFEKEARLTASEEYARELLESNHDHVVRTTPGMLEDLEEKFPRICEVISKEVREDAEADISDIFRPGVPDFLAFEDTGEYKFVEVKTEGDGLRSSQLGWIRDFNQVKAEIWFTTPEEVEKELDAEKIEAYTFQDRKGEKSKNRIVEERASKYLVEMPKTLASILGLEKTDSVKWRLKSKDELILDSK